MLTRKFYRKSVILVFLFILCATLSSGKEKKREFSFLQVSDIHISPAFKMPSDFSRLRSYKCVSTIKNLGEVSIPAFKIMAPKPSFLLVTGDIVEYGFPGVTWDVVHRYFKGVKQPIYFEAGNHDNTWVADTNFFRKKYGGMNYSFNYKGCHFIGLNDSTIQDPIPSYGEEALRFIAKDLPEINRETPVFLFFHHPMFPGEFCSRYDYDRVMDMFRGYNVVLIMDGHGHVSIKHNYEGFDGIEGGSPFTTKHNNSEGFNVIYVHGDWLYAAYKRCCDSTATKPYFAKKFMPPKKRGIAKIVKPQPGEIIKGSRISVKAMVTGMADVTEMKCTVDDKVSGELKGSSKNAVGNINLKTLEGGAHYLRVRFKSKSGNSAIHSTFFYLRKDPSKHSGTALWRFSMAGGSKTTPLYYKGNLYIGSNDGKLYILDAKTGKQKGSFNAHAEILSSPVEKNGLILFGCGNGSFYALDSGNNQIKWTYKTGKAIYSSPIVDDNGLVYFGDNAAKIHALKVSDGSPVWTNSDASYSVESAPFVTENRVYFGAWDGNLYALDRKTGKLIWKSTGPKNQERARPTRYYAPADNGPLAVGNKVFIADRGHILGMYDSTGKYLKKFQNKTSAISLSANKKAIYARCLNKNFTKYDLNGNVLWSSDVIAGRLPISPTEKDGKVYICTNSGLLCCVNAKTGDIEWKYRVSPHLYVMAGVAVHDGVAYTAGIDGVVTAVTATWK